MGAADDFFMSCSNAGRWGASDERGTLNFITAAKLVQATRLVREGEVVSLAHDLVGRDRPKDGSVFRHRMLGPDAGDAASTLDCIEICSHGYSITHLDAVGHVSYRGQTYNGRRLSESVNQGGLCVNSIMAMKDGILTRGVFLDVAEARGVPWLEAGEGVSDTDLSTAEEFGGWPVESGDAIFVRVGLASREAALGVEDFLVRAGLSESAVAWVHEREVALFSGDCVDQIPNVGGTLRAPLHQVGLAAMGMCLLDNTNVDALRDATRRHGTNQFLLCVAPLRIVGGTGSPVNPVAVF